MLLQFCEWLQHNHTLLAICGYAPFAAALEVIHYVGVFILVGTIVLVDLRVIGVAARRRRLDDLAGQLFRYGWGGLAMVAASGFMMFTTNAADYYSDPTFRIKMAVTAFAIIFGLIVQKGAATWGRTASAPFLAKCVALVSLLLLFGSILAGNQVPAISGIG
jgi:uncharacterized membrane protein